MTFYVQLLANIRHNPHYTELAYRFLPYDTLNGARCRAIKVYKNHGCYEISINGKNAQLDVGHPKMGVGITKSDKGGPSIGFVVKSSTGKWFWVSNEKYPTVKPINEDGSIIGRGKSFPKSW